MGPFARTCLLLLACACSAHDDQDWTASFGDPGSAFTDADGVYQGPTLVHRAYLDCLGTEGPWVYGVYTYGWASDADITIHQWYPDATETHALPSVDRGDDNQWDHRLTELALVPEGTPPARGTTALDCDWSFYTWRYRLWGPDESLSDCVVFGYDPSRLDPGRRCRLFVLQGR